MLYIKTPSGIQLPVESGAFSRPNATLPRQPRDVPTSWRGRPPWCPSKGTDRRGWKPAPETSARCISRRHPVLVVRLSWRGGTVRDKKREAVQERQNIAEIIETLADIYHHGRHAHNSVNVCAPSLCGLIAQQLQDEMLSCTLNLLIERRCEEASLNI